MLGKEITKKSAPTRKDAIGAVLKYAIMKETKKRCHGGRSVVANKRTTTMKTTKPLASAAKIHIPAIKTRMQSQENERFAGRPYPSFH